MSNVKLAIRIRPFSERELKSGSDRVRVINVIDDNYVTITNIKVSLSGAGDSRERVRRYHADYTFDSACSSNQPTYATQEKVFEAIGRDVLTGISRGCSTCVLAYGQSATGKTHTMMGSDVQPGLVPRICKALAEEQPCDITVRWVYEDLAVCQGCSRLVRFHTPYDNIASFPFKLKSCEFYKVIVEKLPFVLIAWDEKSFLEIYNERVHDLLASDSSTPTCHSLPRRRGNSRKDLRVREHPTKGPYVQNLRRVAVNNVDALLALVSEGTKRRRTAATRRNSTSSRSHALLEIATSRGVLYLADLAGSEKAGWEGCGGRQKEGANINKSLVALSNVISALVSGGGGRGKFVPYRDSALTWLLKDSFTGGATTFIIATVSPSFACYGESASTLRWAARARQLRTPKPPFAISLSSRAVLQAQYDKLIAELGRNFIQYIPESGNLLFGDQHWVLYNTTFESKDKVELADTNICNNMNQPQLKLDASSESTASSAASGSSDIVHAIDNNKITNAINEEVNKILGPALERTGSGSNLKVIAPLRHKRRQYRSQEVLHPEEKTSMSQSQSLVPSPSQSETQLDIAKSVKNKTPHVAILHENQRAEIVASVTERLYSRLKKKEEAAVSKIETVVGKKIMEPLSELRICTNARQRLMELSQKAIRNKRKIGIPAYTQTRISVTRVKDQATDIQTDLGSYIVENRHMYSFYRDVATETVPVTPRCKEIAVGSNYDSVNFIDISTGTQTRHVPYKTCFVMTDKPTKCNQFTQTKVMPPPRRKKRTSLISNNLKGGSESLSSESVFAPIISINISQTYSVDSETHSSDENYESNVGFIDPRNLISTPDLLTNHSTSDTKVVDESVQEIIPAHNGPEDDSNSCDTKEKIPLQKDCEDFSDQEECQLPRVTVDTSIPTSNFEMKNIILGRNKTLYPYNIVLSPLREKAHVKRIVTFKDLEYDNTINITSESSSDWNDGISKTKPILISQEDDEPEQKYIGTLGSIYSDSSDSSKADIDSNVWRKGKYAKTMVCPRKNDVSVYKSKPRQNTLSERNYKRSIKHEYNSADEIYGIGNIYSSSSERASTRNRDLEIKTDIDSNIEPNYDIDFDNCEKNINACCNDLEQSIKRYDDYLVISRNQKPKEYEKKPKEFLKELVQLRREVIKSSGDTTDSTMDIFQEKN